MRRAALAALLWLALGGATCRQRGSELGPVDIHTTPLGLLRYLPASDRAEQPLDRLCAAEVRELIGSVAVTRALDYDGGWLRREIGALSKDISLDPLGDIDQLLVAWYPRRGGKLPFVLAARGRFDPNALSRRVLREGARRVRLGVQLIGGPVMMFPDTGIVVVASADMMARVYGRIDGSIPPAQRTGDLGDLLSELGGEHQALFYQRFGAGGWTPPPELGALAGTQRMGFIGDLEEGLHLDGIIDLVPAPGVSRAGQAATRLRAEIARMAEHPVAAIAGAVRYLEAAAFEGNRERLRVAYRLPSMDVNVLVGQLMAGARLFRRVEPTPEDVARVDEGTVDDHLVIDPGTTGSHGEP